MYEKAEKYWHEFFVFGVWIKSFTGALEILSGLAVLLISPAHQLAILQHLSRGEWTEAPQDFFVAYSHQYISHLTTGTRIFAGLYILSHGIINLFLVWGLVKQKPAAYLIAVGVLVSFMFYQILRIALHFSPLLIVLTIFDAFFVVLIWHEYKGLVKKLGIKALLKD